LRDLSGTIPSISFPLLVGAQQFTITDLAGIEKIDLPVYTGAGLTFGAVDFSSNSGLKTINVPKVDFNNLNGTNKLSFINNPALETIDLSQCIWADLAAVDFSGNALSQANVDAILIRADDSGATNGVMDLSGGTSSAPSAAGAAAVTSLLAKGWTVTTN
jgi:hypothetical protein